MDKGKFLLQRSSFWRDGEQGQDQGRLLEAVAASGERIQTTPAILSDKL